MSAVVRTATSKAEPREEEASNSRLPGSRVRPVALPGVRMLRSALTRFMKVRRGGGVIGPLAWTAATARVMAWNRLAGGPEPPPESPARSASEELPGGRPDGIRPRAPAGRGVESRRTFASARAAAHLRRLRALPRADAPGRARRPLAGADPLLRAVVGQLADRAPSTSSCPSPSSRSGGSRRPASTSSPATSTHVGRRALPGGFTLGLFPPSTLKPEGPVGITSNPGLMQRHVPWPVRNGVLPEPPTPRHRGLRREAGQRWPRPTWTTTSGRSPAPPAGSRSSSTSCCAPRAARGRTVEHRLGDLAEPAGALRRRRQRRALPAGHRGARRAPDDPDGQLQRHRGRHLRGHRPRSASRACSMVPDRGVFFEFVPAAEHGKPDATPRPALGGGARRRLLGRRDHRVGPLRLLHRRLRAVPERLPPPDGVRRAGRRACSRSPRS